MQIIVQKFGGTSVATPAVRDLVVTKIRQAREQGYCPVVVVSAMGRKGDAYATDTLIGMVRAAYQDIAPRELDQVMYCGELISAVVMAGTLQALGLDAVALTGGQAGIITDNQFNNARILRIDTEYLLQLLKSGRIPVVCGFQGRTVDGDFTTLGRGGSDTTAAALGAALNAEMVEIYTDVDGIMTADPRMVSNAKILDCVSYAEVCQLAHQGAKVIHPRAVEIAMQKNIPMTVKSTFSDEPGTLITNVVKDNGGIVTDRIATGVTYLNNIAQIKVDLQASKPSGNFTVFKTLAEHKINVDLINVHPGQMMFTVSKDTAGKAYQQLLDAGYAVELLMDCSKVSIVGGGMLEVPGVMANFAEALADHDIPILQTVDSNTTISVLIKQEYVSTAVAALHEKFGLAE